MSTGNTPAASVSAAKPPLLQLSPVMSTGNTRTPELVSWLEGDPAAIEPGHVDREHRTEW